MTAETTTDLDALRDIEWMSQRINKSVDWIAHNMRRVPHVKIGRNVRFTERLAREFIEAATVRPASGQTKASRQAAQRRAAS